MAQHRIIYKVGQVAEEVVVHVEEGKSLLTAVAEATGIAANLITISDAWRKHTNGETKVK